LCATHFARHWGADYSGVFCRALTATASRSWRSRASKQKNDNNLLYCNVASSKKPRILCGKSLLPLSLGLATEEVVPDCFREKCETTQLRPCSLLMKEQAGKTNWQDCSTIAFARCVEKIINHKSSGDDAQMNRKVALTHAMGDGRETGTALDANPDCVPPSLPSDAGSNMIRVRASHKAFTCDRQSHLPSRKPPHWSTKTRVVKTKTRTITSSPHSGRFNPRQPIYCNKASYEDPYDEDDDSDMYFKSMRRIRRFCNSSIRALACIKILQQK